ncbi:hypothetical protein CesoFtcFv8_022596 [Champsocephalus esox]|uniref:Uncharacterized protein n=1 Tax=Champsocephalus esox TaxID=159716 RepID=A0AAN8B6H6_9TELE|nr:hypothetical protein CesoFtcFv8_022596 [Champsocephalus esox]
MADTDRHRDPHSTVERLSLNFLPPAVHRLLFSQSGEFPGARLLLRALYGAVSGTALFLGLCRRLPLTFDLQLAAAAVFIGVCAACCSCSSSCRCSLLLMFPSMLGTRGRAYVMLLLLTVLCRGPLSNIQSNVEAAALSLSCNLDLQIHHSKVLWRETLSPYILISQQLMVLERDSESLHHHLSAAHGNYDNKVLERDSESLHHHLSAAHGNYDNKVLERDSESLHHHLSAAHGNYDNKVLWRETLSPYILISQQLMVTMTTRSWRETPSPYITISQQLMVTMTTRSWRETLSPYITTSQQLMVTMTTRSWRDSESLHHHLSAAHGNYDNKVLERL